MGKFFSQKGGAWLLGLQQVLLLLSSQQIPLFLPQLCLNPQGSRALSIAAPELCLLLVALRQHLQMIFRISWSWCFHMLRAHLRKAPAVSIITLLSLQSKGNSFFQ